MIQAPSPDSASGLGQPYLLIEYEWFAEVTGELREELRSFAREAMAYDAEAGFTIARDLDGPPGPTDGPPRRLVARLASETKDSDHQCGSLAAYLSITDVDDRGVGTAVLVVAPELRSRGIATLLVERLARESPGDDWFGTGLSGLRAMADGAHPAAGRLADRFGFELVGETWCLLRMLRGPAARTERVDGPAVSVEESVTGAEIRGGVPTPAPEVDPEQGRRLVERTYQLTAGPAGAVAVTRHSIAANGAPDGMAWMSYGVATADLRGDEIDALIAAATSDLYSAGARSVLARVNPAADAIVRASRRTYFQHDQSDLVFFVPVPGAR